MLPQVVILSRLATKRFKVMKELTVKQRFGLL